MVDAKNAVGGLGAGTTTINVTVSVANASSVDAIGAQLVAAFVPSESSGLSAVTGVCRRYRGAGTSFSICSRVNVVCLRV